LSSDGNLDNLLVENRNGLIANAELLQANGPAERDAAPLMREQFLVTVASPSAATRDSIQQSFSSNAAT
jgi:hypothetical protein